MFDILITIAPKDYNKLPFVLEAIYHNIKGVHNYYIISPTAIPDEYAGLGIKLLNDRDALDYDFSKIIMENRRGWYRQQFIKLFQTITADNYVVVDGDVIINKPIEVNPAHPYFYLGRDQNHTPYFECFKLICNLDKVYPHSFISEIMHFKRGVIKYLLDNQHRNRKEFIDKCVECINTINNPSGFSEYELYGNYVVKNWKDFYQFKQLKVQHQWKKRMWTTDEIKQYIAKYKDSDRDILTMHSWM